MTHVFVFRGNINRDKSKFTEILIWKTKEYEAEMVRSVAYMLNDYSELPKDAILLALETEG